MTGSGAGTDREQDRKGWRVEQGETGSKERHGVREEAAEIKKKR